MDATALRQIAASPAAFRAVVRIDTDHGPARLDRVADDWQLRDFTAMDDAWRRVAGQSVEVGCQRAYLERPRGHSKTADLAISAAWSLAFSRRQLSIVAAAADKDQAKLLRDATARLVSLNPWLAGTLDVQAYRVVNTRTQSELVILSSDAATSYGLTPDAILIDELTHWQSRDLWDSLISAAAKRAHCLVVIISNAGYGQTWQSELRDSIQRDAGWYFSRLDGPRASWITPDRLDEQRRLLPPIAFRRLWLNEWTSGVGDALTEADIQAACVLDGPCETPERGWVYLSALDLGLTRDASALITAGVHVGYVEESPPPPPAPVPRTVRIMQDAGLLERASDFRDGVDGSEATGIVCEGTGRIRLCSVDLWQGHKNRKVDVASIEQRITTLHDRMQLACVAFDVWQAQYLGQRLAKQGIVTLPVDFTGSSLKSMASATLEAFGQRQIELYPHDELIADLGNLGVVEKSYGMRLESPRTTGGQGTAHGDTATALAILLHAAKQFSFGARARVEGPLVTYP